MPVLPRRVSRLAAGRAALLLAAITLAIAPSAAYATTTISGVRVSAVSSSSFTVTLDSLGSGWTYKLYASTTKADVYYDSLASAPHQSAVATTPRVTLSSLPYSSGVYWYRVQATSGSSHHTGDILAVGLVPATPTGLTVGGSAHHGMWLTWSAGAGAGFVVEQSSTSGFTSGVRDYAIRGAGHQFTPYGMSVGRRYWFRVRAANSGTYSAWSPTVSTVASSHAQGVRVGTYNVLEDWADGTKENNNTISPWSQRGPAVVAGIKASGASVVAVQEAAGFVGPQCAYRSVGVRQVDDMVKRLGSSWSLATTEVRPCLPGWLRTGDYVIYDHTKFGAVGSGGQWAIGTSSYQRWAVYQVLRSTSTGGSFLFVSAHLIVGDGSTYDRLRETEAATMISDAKAYAAAHGNVPIIFGGDFNSHELHPLDGPAVAMRAAHASDALLVAPTRVNTQYNSANGYLRTPPGPGVSIDHIYGMPGIAIASWKLVLNLSGGQFVGVIPSDHNLLVGDTSYPY